MLLIFGVSVLFFGCSENNLNPALDDPGQIEQEETLLKGAKKPSAMLEGTTNTPFTIELGPTYWNGTVDFGVYGVPSNIAEGFLAPLRRVSSCSI